MGRIIGIDFGQARIGLAVSDLTQMLASPVKMLPAKKTLKETAEVILLELDGYEEVDCIVLGLPLLLNGKESPSSLQVRELKKNFEELTEIPIHLWDERLTTTQVERTLKEAQMSRKKRTKYIDAMAAAAILQSYLDSPR